MSKGIFCVLGAMVGAGLASGREIVQFFSQYGALSWWLVGLASGMTGWLAGGMMGRGDCIRSLLPSGKGRWAGNLLMGVLLSAVSGGMTAAAGELAALTLPLPHARMLGGAGTLLLCAALAHRSLRGLAVFSRLLLPLLTGAFLLCLRLPASAGEAGNINATDACRAAVGVMGYCGMNALLSAEIVCEAGRGKSAAKKKRLGAGIGVGMGFLLALGNGALLRHIETVRDAALPTVLLLRALGKPGFYLSACLLYLAVITTLLAALRGLRALIVPYAPKHAGSLSALAAALLSLIGFQGIVANAYPFLGGAGLLLLLLPRRRMPDIQ